MALKKFFVVTMRVIAKTEAQALSKAKKAWRKKHKVKHKDFDDYPTVSEI